MVKTSILSPVTFSRILFSALAIVALGVVVNAQETPTIEVVRTNGTATPVTGTDVSTVQTTAGYASGDVISVSGTSETSLAPFSTEVRADGTSSNPYNVYDFTVQSGTSDIQYISAPPAGKRNYIFLVGNKEYNLTFKNVDFQNNDTPQNNSGIFLHMNQASSSVTLNLDNASFSKYKAQIGTNNNTGAIIYSLGDVTIKGKNTVSFKGNVAYSGGVIFASKALTINCDEIIFDSNSTYNSGAIRNNKALSITGSKVTFSNNSASNKGGSIYTSSSVTMTGTGDNPIFTFSGNKATDQGGVIYSDTNGTGIDINCNTIKFSGNQASAGGAIAFEITNTNNKVKITGKSVTFENNATTNGNGGAIHTQASVELKGSSNDSVFTFSKNSSVSNAGVMVVVGTVDISTGAFKFEKNSANGTSSTNGFAGAIEARKGITFHEDGTSATFTGNIAYSGKGNDIYLTNNSVLTFKDSGTYYFDGGIYLVNTGASTVINKAQVTIAGRQYKPVINEGDPENVEDHTNNYQLQTVNISNGGKLTANLDYIDSLTGKFNLGTADTVGTLELNVDEGTFKLTMSDTFNITGATNGKVVKTGDGTLQILAADGQVNSHSFVVNSGRLDMKEYFTGSLEIGEQTSEGEYSAATFSPGNSVGSLTINGDFVLNPGSTLLIEQDATGIDTLSATSFQIASDSILDLPVDSLQPGMSTAIIQSTNAFDDPLSSDAFWNGLLTSDSAYYWNLKVVNGNTVMASVDGNAVPEPSTWALLSLGVVGLMYWRKRK